MADEINTAESLELDIMPSVKPNMFLVVYGEGQNQLLEIKPGKKITIGRGRSATISLPDRELSKLKVHITLDKHQSLCLEERGDSQKVLVNGKKIESTVTLVSGDEIRIGSLTLVVGTFDKDANQEQRKSLVRPFSIFEAILPAELDRASRYKRPLTLLMIRLTGNEERDDVLAELLGRNLRPMDFLSAYAPRQFAAVLPEAGDINGLGVARRLLETGKKAGGQLEIGSASYPVDADHTETLIGKARLALSNASSSDDGLGIAPKGFEDVSSKPIYASKSMIELMEQIEEIALSPLSVLIIGEKGVGKDTIVQEIHQKSSRAEKPLMKLHCASLPEILLESELFGYEEGAFQGASEAHKGLLERANGGTLFLDAISEMSALTQTKFLRVLGSKRLRRIGGTEEIALDIRLITASHHNIEHIIENNVIRPDLLFHLDTFTLEIPPLRTRPEDVLPLAEHFLQNSLKNSSKMKGKISPYAARLLCAYDWPGNVRELRNVMGRAALIMEGDELLQTHLSEKINKQDNSTLANNHTITSPSQNFALQDEVAIVERETLIRALEACGGNRTHAAERLGISRRALLYKIEKYDLRDIGK